MIHQLRDKKQIAKKRLVRRNIIIVGVLVLVSLTPLLPQTSKFLAFIGRPIWKAKNTVVDTAQSAKQIVRTKASVYAENESLKKENMDLHNEMLDYQIIKAENDQLKELMGRLPAKEDFVLATILTKPNQSPYDTIIIDAGSSTGITEGAQVFGNATVPIGEVSKVYKDNALVMLYSNPEQITEGVLDGSNTSVELVGRGGGNFEMNIPVDLPSENGKQVVLPNTKTDIIAIIDGVLSSPTDPIKKVLLHSPVNIQSLKWVQVKKY